MNRGSVRSLSYNFFFAAIYVSDIVFAVDTMYSTRYMFLGYMAQPSYVASSEHPQGYYPCAMLPFENGWPLGDSDK